MRVKIMPGARVEDSSLIDRLESGDDVLRAGALEEVTTTREEIYLPYIVASLYHLNPDIRRKAATALRGIRKDLVADVALLALTTEKDPEVVFDIIMVFLYRPKEEAIAELVPYLNYPDFKVRSAAVDVLGALGSIFGRFEMVGKLMELLSDPRPSVVMVTLRALAHLVESLEDVRTMEMIGKNISELEEIPNRMVSELASTVRRQVEGSITLLKGN
ncbi:MAG: HEAT repeat domain-containing protein [Actinomycetota bacterium]|nr:HEAT repeat domain-containing protein [Actinomycetota bacterium]